jgi:hypothetical protein
MAIKNENIRSPFCSQPGVSLGAGSIQRPSKMVAQILIFRKKIAALIALAVGLVHSESD